jgi:hypothetical protein
MRPGHAPGVLAGENAVVQRFEGDAFLCELALEVLVAVDAQLGVVGEVRTVLQKERPEVLIHAVEVVLVDHGRGLDDPRIGLAGLWMPALFGAEDRGLLLRLADEEDAFCASGCTEAGQVLFGKIVLALVAGEGRQGDSLLFRERLDGRDERPGDPVHERGGGEDHPPVLLEEADHAKVHLKLRNIDVQVHPVDSFELQSHMIVQERGDAWW